MHFFTLYTGAFPGLLDRSVGINIRVAIVEDSKSPKDSKMKSESLFVAESS